MLATVKKSRVPVTRKLPREILRDLRTRAGLSAAEVARALGYKSTGGYHGYETDKQRDKLIPYDVVKKLLPILVGRGTPPIKNEELIAISEASGWSDAGPATRTAPVGVATALPVKYRIERGVYLDDTVRSSKRYGMSWLLPSPSFEGVGQWVAIVADEEPSTMLHCVDLEHVPAHRRAGMRCVSRVEKAGTGLYEIAVSKFRGDGTAENGTAVGVVIGAYRPE